MEIASLAAAKSAMARTELLSKDRRRVHAARAHRERQLLTSIGDVASNVSMRK
jgi:hypothetical protein